MRRLLWISSIIIKKHSIRWKGKGSSLRLRWKGSNFCMSRLMINIRVSCTRQLNIENIQVRMASRRNKSSRKYKAFFIFLGLKVNQGFLHFRGGYQSVRSSQRFKTRTRNKHSRRSFFLKKRIKKANLNNCPEKGRLLSKRM